MNIWLFWGSVVNNAGVMLLSTLSFQVCLQHMIVTAAEHVSVLQSISDILLAVDNFDYENTDNGSGF